LSCNGFLHEDVWPEVRGEGAQQFNADRKPILEPFHDKKPAILASHHKFY